VLSRLSADDTRWKAVLVNLEITADFCLLVAAEGLDDYLIGWLKTAKVSADVEEYRASDAERTDMKTREGRLMHAWRGSLLRSLVEAKLELSQMLSDTASVPLNCNTNSKVGSADSVLIMFFNIHKQKMAPENRNLQATSLWPAFLAIRKALSGGLYPHTSVHL
jgi:hypothetical protein